MQRLTVIGLLIFHVGLVPACGEVTMPHADAASDSDAAVPDSAVVPDADLPSSMALGVGGAMDEVPADIALGSDGSVYVIGRFSGFGAVTNLGGDDLVSAGGADIFVVRYGPDGQHIWSRAFGSPEPDLGHAIAVDANDDVYVTGTFQQSIDPGGGPITSNGLADIFVAKLSGADGGHLWSFGMGGASHFDSSNDLIVAPSGDVVVAGYFRGTVNFGGGDRTSNADSVDMFVARYEGATGQHQWSLTYGGSGGDGAEAVAVDGEDVLVTGFFLSDDASFGGEVLSRRGDRDMFLARYGGGDGRPMWSFGHGGAGADDAMAMASQGGKLVITGRYAGSPDLGGEPLPDTGGAASNGFMAMYDAATGSHLWSAGHGGSGTDEGLAVDMPAGAVVLGGSFTGEDASFGLGTLAYQGGSDAVVARYGSGNGDAQWTLATGSPGEDAVTAVSARGDAVVVAGYYEGVISIAGMDVMAAGGGQKDMFIARLIEE